MTQVAAPKLIIATRGSTLALWQARFVAGLLAATGVESEQLVLKTTGDRVQDRFLHEIGGKGLFIKELEEALLARRADLAVHSLKDMPAKLHAPFALGAVLPRHAATDVLILRDDVASRLQLPSVLSAADVAKLGALRVGTGSLRRQAILRRVAPSLQCVGVRGNVDTRLRKLAEGAWDGLILAEASLDRLGITQVHRHRLGADWFIPCAAQGALAIEIRANDPVASLLASLACQVTTSAVAVERQVLARLGGDCTMPFGCLVEKGEDGSWSGRAAIYGPAGEVAEGRAQTNDFTVDALAASLLDDLRQHGAASVLQALGLAVPPAWH